MGLASLTGADLDAPRHGVRQPRAWLVRGAAAHDLYHGGQIPLLKRLRDAER